jgi:signal transduction histidine kinase
MQPAANERQIQLRTAVADAGLNAVLDARAIQQALVNLIDNASSIRRADRKSQ